MKRKYDFSGWATKNDICCSDGRTIRRNAFKQNDGARVPLVWNHSHNDPTNVLGHADLENRDNGVYAYCTLNDTKAGKTVRQLIQHGDVTALSIYANKLKQSGTGDVLHGDIKEVSVVLAGANPEALIDSSDVAIAHGDDVDSAGVLAFLDGDDASELIMHSDEEDEEKKKQEAEVAEEPAKESEETKPMAENEQQGGGKTVKEVFDTLTEEQKTVVYALIGQALEDAKNGKGADDTADEEGDDEEMKHNVFDNDYADENVISHSEIQEAIADSKKYGSMKASFEAHGIDDIVCHAAGVEQPSGGSVTYGIKGVDFLFPDAHELNSTPKFLKGDTGWADVIMNGTSHTPFGKVKCTFADDLSEDEARARGYITGKRKKEMFFSLIRRSVEPTTVYIKQKMDRDQVVDITDFDVVQWINSRMDMKLRLELARAAIIGDGRLSSSEDKIDENRIRPVFNDDDLFTIKHYVEEDTPASLIDETILAQENYQGSGNTTCFMEKSRLNAMLLLKDVNGRRIYNSAEEVAKAMCVNRIVTFPVMKGLKTADNRPVYEIILDLSDYTFGADKGGATKMFDDFDIDYNQMKYLKEGRCSGMLTEPYSAIVVAGQPE